YGSSGNDTLVLNDANNSTGYPWSVMPTYTLNNNSIQFSQVTRFYETTLPTHNLSVAYSGINQLEIRAGNTADEINIESHDRDLPAYIYAGGGDDVVRLSPDRHKMPQGSFLIEGGEGTDSLIFNDDNLRDDPIWGTTNDPTWAVGADSV